MKLLFIILFSCILYPSFSQDDSPLQLVKSYPVQAVDVAIDNLDNFYIVTETDGLKKYNASGDSVAVYNNVKRFGKLQAIDVTNPLKILLFYKDFSQIVILDRLLSLRGAIDLRKLNIVQSSAIGLSYDNNIWLFDEYNNRLKKIDEEGTVLQETPDFRNIFNFPFLPQQIIDDNNLVHLYDPQNGLLIFDHFGTYKRKVDIKGWQRIALSGKYIVGVNEKALNVYNTTSLMEQQFHFPAGFTPYYHYNFYNNKLMALSKDSVSVFSYRY